MDAIVDFVSSIPLPIWMILGAILGWFIGDLVKKAVLPKTAGTLWIVNYGDGVTDFYLEMSEEVPPDKIKDYLRLTFDVKMRNKD